MTPGDTSACVAPGRPVTGYLPGQRVFGRHGATLEYFHGRVVAVEPDHVFPYTVELGAGELIQVVGHEIESDLPAPGVGWEELVDWLLP
jgi:hypothetical protein